ncbi:MAG: hypothetical protein RIR51_415 [Bacteroidota bacterium]|jgi:hypothetical protein
MIFRKQKAFIILTFLFFGNFTLNSCIQNIDRKGMTEEKVIEILVDLHKAEVFVDDLHFRDLDSSIVLFKQFEKDVYLRHNVDSTSFNTVLQNYVRYPDDYNRIYSEVYARLKSIKPEFKTKRME